MRHRIAAFVVLLAACGGSVSTNVAQSDPPDDCRSAFADGPVPCGPGADISSVTVDPTGPITVIIELTDAPQYDDAFQWLTEFTISDLACGLTNTASTGQGYEGGNSIGPYGYRILTNEDAPPGTCEGSLDGTTATITFNIQPPLGRWTIVGGTQHVEIANLEDEGSADDVVIEVIVE